MKHYLHFTPQPGELYFTVQEHLKNALRFKTGLLPNKSKELEDLIGEAQRNVKHLFNLPDEFEVLVLRSTELLYKFFFNTAGVRSICFTGKSQLSQRCKLEIGLTDKVKLVDFVPNGNPVPEKPYVLSSDLVVVEHDDLADGTRFDPRSIEKNEQLVALDVSYSLTNVSFDPGEVDMVFFNANAALGLPFNFFVVLVKKEWVELSAWNAQSLSDLTPIEWHVLAKVSGDFLFKGLEQINREINYKAALLQQAIAENKFLNLPEINPASASKNIFVAHSEKPAHDVAAQLMILGMVVGADERLETLTFANYPVHSKEQFEILTDNIARIK